MALPWKRKETQAEAEASAESTQRQLDRPTADEIFEQVARNARGEIERSAMSLSVSGVAGGLAMGLTPLAMSISVVNLGDNPLGHLVAYLLYPIGFITVILGRAQLFTENTLYPVALVLAERRHLWGTLRLWGIVLCSNIAGAALFALLMAHTSAITLPMLAAMSHFGVQACIRPAPAIFWSGVLGGWMIAMVAWLVSGSHSITGSAMLIWLLAFVVGLGGFAHCIAASGEILTAVFHGQLALAQYFHWLLFAVCGNITGGVLMVTLLEYGQVKASTLPPSAS
ncbi:MAG: formate/nitrite transporter family protein [Acidobacteriaceae bacterium]